MSQYPGEAQVQSTPQLLEVSMFMNLSLDITNYQLETQVAPGCHEMFWCTQKTKLTYEYVVIISPFTTIQYTQLHWVLMPCYLNRVVSAIHVCNQCQLNQNDCSNCQVYVYIVVLIGCHFS